jgi:predicted transcriptional regulator
MVTKNDRAWESLFASHNIVAAVEQAGFYRITATAINQEREARLMTKFDQEVNLPQIFKDNQLAILPDSRGSYLIGRFQTYQTIEDDESVEVADMAFPTDIESIDPTNLYSEASALFCAYNSQILDDVAGEEVRFTVGGRMSTGRFDYLVDIGGSGAASQRIAVNNAQAEIDGGFESASNLVLVEAKNYGATDFLIRQLYYPYRLWRGKSRKQVIPVFMSFSNDVFSFYVYRFANDDVYNSIELVTQKKYRIAPINIQLADIMTLLSEVERQPAAPEPASVPFPQADSFTRIFDLLGLLYANESLSKEQITTNYAFDSRQTDYYTNAAIYLGLVQKRREQGSSVEYLLTDEGKNIYSMPARARRMALARSVLKHRVFSRALRSYFDNSERPSVSSVVEIMRDERIQITSTTMPRRAQTVLSWIDWILKLGHPS